MGGAAKNLELVVLMQAKQAEALLRNMAICCGLGVGVLAGYSLALPGC